MVAIVLPFMSSGDMPLKIPTSHLQKSELEQQRDQLVSQNARLALENEMLRQQSENARLSLENEMLRQQSEALAVPLGLSFPYHTSAMWPWSAAACSTLQDSDAQSTTVGSAREAATSAGSELEVWNLQPSQASEELVDVPEELGDHGTLPSMEHAVAQMPTYEIRTTMMIRNLPSAYNRDTILWLLEEKGFNGGYDLIYVPIDFETRACVGYGFVNFVNSAWALQFQACFQGFRNWGVQSEKTCDVAWSDSNQGFAEHVDKYRNSPVMHPSVPDEFRPVIFAFGLPVPFPPPTKRLHAPRLRKKD